MTYKLSDLEKGARNFAEVMRVEKGTNVLLLRSKQQWDPVFIDAVERAVEEAGGNCISIRTGRNLGRQFMPEPIGEAMKLADIVAGISHSHPPADNYKLEYGTNFVRLDAGGSTAEGLASSLCRLPPRLAYAVLEKIAEIIEDAAKIRVTTPSGTDIEMSQMPTANALHRDTPFGLSESWPVAQFGFYPTEPCNGVICADYIQVVGNPSQYFVLEDPLRITVENHKAVKVEGSVVEDIFKEKLFTSKFAREDPLTQQVAECMWGTRSNVKIDLPPQMEFQKHGTSRLKNRCDFIHIVFGGGGPTCTAAPPWEPKGPFPVGTSHSSAWCLMHLGNVYVDGQKLIDDGCLTVLKDREIQKLAKELGADEGWDVLPPLPEGVGYI